MVEVVSVFGPNFEILHSFLFSGKNKGVKDYIIEMGNTAVGPWTEIADGQLPDIEHGQPKVAVSTNNPSLGSYLQFRCVTWYEEYCALQYIGIFNNA